MWGLFRIIAITFAACIGSSEGGFKKMKVLTYNAGLQGSVVPVESPVMREERRDRIITALNAGQADFICLQEVFNGEDVSAIVDGVKNKYPHSFSEIHNDDGTVDGEQGPPNVLAPVCDPVPFVSLVVCLTTNCFGISDFGALLTCGTQFCLTELTAIFATASQECMTCFITTTPRVDEFFDTCANVDSAVALRRINAPGLLMLSRKPLRQTKAVDFHPGTVEAYNRGYLQAKVGSKTTKIQAVCAGLSFVQPIPYFELNLLGKFTSWEEQNLFEINTLVQKFGDKDRVVILGGFNVGPEINGALALGEANYNVLTATFDTSIASQCTVCPPPENPWNDPQQNFIVDHIFTLGLSVNKQRNEFQTADSTLFSENVQLALSDHYAVFAKLRKKKP